MFWDKVDLAFEYARRRAAEDDRGQVGTVIQVGVIGIAIITLILVYSEVEQALPINTTIGNDDPANATVLENASTASTDTFGSAMELAPVIMIILLAGVVIAIVQRFRS